MATGSLAVYTKAVVPLNCGANDSNEVLEGIYRMPLPPDAQIERLALEVNGMIQEGAFVARDRAAAIWKGVIHNAAPEKPARPANAPTTE